VTATFITASIKSEIIKLSLLNKYAKQMPGQRDFKSDKYEVFEYNSSQSLPCYPLPQKREKSWIFKQTLK